MWERALALLGLAEEEEQEEAVAGVPRLTVLGSPGSRRERPAPARITVRRMVAFEQVRDLAERLRSGEPVVLNLQACDRETARRILDFLTGVLWAVDGEAHRVGDGILLLAPGGVSVSRDEGEGEGA